ncbi:alkaline phytoceramidase [Neoconidiobolus thromboides FSU 785]|nr:alkaline phytoceramidase [Neoconidiobolus thromboides FSU 785]
MFLNTTSSAPGYWGEITSSVDWCEPNYVHSPYVAETLNTLSSLAMVIIGEMGARINHSTHWKQKFSFHMITIIGIGSILFHMSLKYYTQMLDELPMLWTSALMFNLTLDTRLQNCPSWVSLLIFFYSLSATVITAVFQGELQANLFRLCFVITTYISIFMGFQHYLKNERQSNAGKLFKRGFLFYFIASCVWIIDTKACNWYIQNLGYPAFHALWHVFVSLGIYHLIIYSNYLHQNRFKFIPSKIVFYYGLPFLVKSSKEELKI